MHNQRRIYTSELPDLRERMAINGTDVICCVLIVGACFAVSYFAYGPPQGEGVSVGERIFLSSGLAAAWGLSSLAMWLSRSVPAINERKYVRWYGVGLPVFMAVFLASAALRVL